MQAIDVHCHVYPQKIAHKAVEAVGSFYDIPMDVEDGTTEGLLRACEGSPISRFVIHSVATRPDQVRSINDFIASECALHPELTGFMTLHQDLSDDQLEAEVEHACEAGLRGIKLHPDTQAVNMDDPRLMRVYEIAESKQLPMIVHCGDYRFDFSHPKRMKRILGEFPDLVVDAAHFGGWSVFDLAVEYLEGENCFMDMSSSIAFIGKRRTRELIRHYGADRIMFGSDFPMWDPVHEMEELSQVGLADAELQKLLGDNALRFLGER